MLSATNPDCRPVRRYNVLAAEYGFGRIVARSVKRSCIGCSVGHSPSGAWSGRSERIGKRRSAREDPFPEHMFGQRMQGRRGIFRAGVNGGGLVGMIAFILAVGSGFTSNKNRRIAGASTPARHANFEANLADESLRNERRQLNGVVPGSGVVENAHARGRFNHARHRQARQTR
jgi:hypothetical protein